MNLVLSVVLAKSIGAAGIILATIISMLVAGLPWESAVVLKKVFHVKCGPYIVRYVYYTLATAAACFASYRICAMIQGAGILAFLVKGVICAVVSAVVLIVAYAPLPEFRASIALGIKVIKNHGK